MPIQIIIQILIQMKYILFKYFNIFYINKFVSQNFDVKDKILMQEGVKIVNLSNKPNNLYAYSFYYSSYMF